MSEALRQLVNDATGSQATAGAVSATSILTGLSVIFEYLPTLLALISVGMGISLSLMLHRVHKKRELLVDKEIELARRRIEADDREREEHNS